MPSFRSGVLVGRENELTELRHAAERARSGEPTTAVLIGEAGVGKSRLAAEVANEIAASGGLVIRSHGVELAGGELPFAGFAEVMRGLVRARGSATLDALLGEQRDALGPLLPGPQRGIDAELSRSTAVAAAITLLESLATDDLVCWVIDDLPWLDRSTRDLATYVASVADGARLLLLCTARTETTLEGSSLPADVLAMFRAPGAITIQLEPLTRSQVVDLVTAVRGQEVDPAELDRIVRSSDGLPFYVEQLLDAGSTEPSALHRVVLAGTTGLSDDARVLLRAASVAESTLLPRLLQQVSRMDSGQFDDAIAEVRDRGVLRVDRSGEILRFRHALLREAVDGEMLAHERRELHRRWATALDEHGSPVLSSQLVGLEIARHRYLAGDGAAAFPSVLAAAQAVAELSDTESQVLWWQRAYDLWPDDQQVVAGFERDQMIGYLVTALTAAGSGDDADALLSRELADPQNDWLRTTWLRAGRARTQRFRGQQAEPIVNPDEADGVLARLLAWPTDFRVDQTLHLVLHEWEYERPDLYEPACEAFLERARARGSGPDAFLGMRHLGWWRLREGDARGRLELAVRAAADAGPAGTDFRFEADNDIVAAHVSAGNYGVAIERGEASMAGVARPHTVPTMYGSLCTFVARAHLARGGWRRAEEVARAGLAVRSSRLAQAALYAVIARSAARRGRIDEARTALAMAPSAMPGIHGELTLDNLRRATATAEIALAEHDPRVIGDALALGFQAPLGYHRHEGWELLLQAARAAAGHPELAEAVRSHIDDVSSSSDPWRDPVGHAAAGEVQSRISGAQAEWSDVIEAWRRLDRSYDATWCQLAEIEGLVVAGRRSEADELAASAWQNAQALGADPLRERIEVLARRSGLHLPPGVVNRAAGLTARETEVLALLAEGSTNEQIAEQLYMAPKTASVHVSRILAKLHAANRTEAAAIARRDGLVPQ